MCSHFKLTGVQAEGGVCCAVKREAARNREISMTYQLSGCKYFAAKVALYSFSGILPDRQDGKQVKPR
jgi:hypothetical protein